ncbi:MAG: GNAT family N-acetyltransferase [Alphaproteobacteria bacterium RIFCSPHIGHO2_12_FULL_63_12]|nr:MAG: GNAT family N-acetyltransferase [Alphaproteobacteria bacterium RIFCSPHIGHO2_12_FULL_63_12]
MLLRPLDPLRDGEALHAIFGDEESCTYMTGPAFATVEETIENLKRWTTGLEDASWAVCESDGGPALGRIALIARGRDIFEAACMIVPAARGKNLAARALAIVIDEAFERRGARRVFADVDPDNIASLRVFERLGFQREGVLRGNWSTHIGERDSVIFGLLKDDPRPWRRR